MTTNEIIEEVRGLLLDKARASQGTVEIFTGPDTFYTHEKCVVFFNREDIAQHILAMNGVNPLNYVGCKYISELRIFEETVLDGDNVNGDCCEWFTVKAHEDSEDSDDGDYICGRYSRVRRLD